MTKDIIEALRRRIIELEAEIKVLKARLKGR